MATFYSSVGENTKISSSGATVYCIWALEATVSGQTVTATAYVYTTGSWVWEGLPATISCKIGSETPFQIEKTADGGKYPSSKTSFTSGSWKISSRTYTRRYKYGTWSESFPAGGSIACSFSYKTTSSANAAPPKDKTFTASGSVSVTPASITITFNDNGGSGGPGTQKGSVGKSLTLSSTKPTRSSQNITGYTISFNGNGGTASASSVTATDKRTYTFNHWTTQAGGGGSSYSPGKAYTFNSNTTLYAQYDSAVTKGSVTTPTASKSSVTNSWTVSFNGNGGNPSSSSATSTSTTTYSCSGWYTSSGGGTKRCNAGSSYTPSASETLYAQYTGTASAYSAVTLPTATRSNTTATRTITFDATTNGGTSNTATLASKSVTSYTLDAWYNSAEGGLVRGSAGAAYIPSATETLYAHWNSSSTDFSQVTLPSASKAQTAETIVIAFDANGGSCETQSLNSTRITTYPFNGWFSQSSGGTNRGSAGTYYIPSNSETLYAQFGTSIGSYSTITLPTPSRPDFIFMGWSEDTSATSGITGQYTPTKATTLYAIWLEDQTKGKFKINGEWKQGKIWVKSNGVWQKSKKTYIKVNGVWVKGK